MKQRKVKPSFLSSTYALVSPVVCRLHVASNNVTPLKRLLVCRVLLLSEISRGGGGVGISNLGSEIRRPIPAMGVKFANPPLELGLNLS